MEEAEQLAIVSDPLLVCCLCKRLLRDAMQLSCLHNCCQLCFSSAASSSCSQGVACGSCGSSMSSGAVRPNSFVDRQVLCYTSIAESKVCGICKGNGEAEKPALLWCPTCRHSLCADCIAGHRQFNRQRTTQSLEELESLEAVCALPSASVCSLHKKPLEVACLNCEQAKCISCWAECLDKSHKMHVAGKEPFDNYVSQFIERITSLERELLQKSEILDIPQKVVRGTKAVRDRHLEQIAQRKRRIVDSVEIAYQEIEFTTRNAYDELIAEGDVAVADAERIASSLSDATSYVKWLLVSDDKCEILNQQKIVRERLSVLSTEVDALSEKLATTSRAVFLDPSMPDDFENVIRQWIGMPSMTSATSSLFGAASSTVQLPVDCCDVGLTQDGRLLLAAGQHGLLEFSSSSAQELSRWQPPKQSDGEDDLVLAVAALSDRRAAVGVRDAQLVLLLRRCETVGSSSQKAEATAAWTEERRLDQLPWPPSCLAAHGDMLAVTESRLDEQQDGWEPGRRLQLLSLSCGRLLGAQRQREYSIWSLAVSARAVVTGSWEPMQLDDGHQAVQVLDAHSLSDGDERLWRHELSSSNEEVLQGVCSDSAGGCLYAAVRRRDDSSGRVWALSLADGSELRLVALSSASPQLLPVRLSLSVGGAAEQQQPGSSSSSRRELQLAGLCWDSISEELRTVTVHSSSQQ